MARASGRRGTAVYLESGARRVFAVAADWPGWARGGKDEESALAALAAYAPRYAIVAREAGVRFPAGAAASFDVVERLDGSTSTDMGIPREAAGGDGEPVTRRAAERTAALLAACWAVLDRVAAGAPAELRKGPRGGGRDRDKIVDHVLGADVAYARKIGLRHRQPARDDTESVAALREDVLAVLRRPSDGGPLAPNGWSARYAARRFAWHALDHAWEIEDRSEPAP